MAISFKNVQNAYKVFNELKRTVHPKLKINSWPEDMSDWSEKKRENPRLNTVYGFDHKADDGWENLIFFVENPTEELIAKFDELKGIVSNSPISKPYNMNTKIWIFGWV